MRRLTNQEFIKRALLVHGDKYDYSLVEYVNIYEKVIIICPIHGKFEQNPQSHYSGKECRQCGSKKSAESNIGIPRCTIGIEKGDKFNRLTVLERLPNNKNQNSVFKCVCDCGNETTILGSMLKNNYIKSCGCLHKDTMFERRNWDAIYKILHRSIRGICRKKNLPFDLTVKDISEIVSQKCEYCKREPYDKKCRYQKTNSLLEDDCLLLNGLDRVIPNKGYVKENIVSCCKYCNRAKSDLSTEEFKNLITLLFENYVKTNN